MYFLGGSPKSGDNTKIGMFGSGWKYALAWLIRNDIKIEVWAGTTEIKIGYVLRPYHNEMRRMITIGDKETSITDEFGPKWTGWMAMREIISNAIDEGSYLFSTDGDVQAKEGYTTIHIEVSDKLKDVANNFDDYFTFNRKDGVTVTTMRYGLTLADVYIKNTPSPMNIYRKGIKCFNNREGSSQYESTFIDMDFYKLEINESRLAEEHDINYEIKRLACDADINETIMLAIFKSKLLHDNIAMEETRVPLLEKMVAAGVIFTTKQLVAVMIPPEGAVEIPFKWYYKLVSLGIIENALNFLIGEDVPMGFVTKPAKFNVNKLIKFLDVFNVKFNIVTGEFKESYVSVKATKEDLYLAYDLAHSDELQIAKKVLTSLPSGLVTKRLEEAYPDGY